MPLLFDVFSATCVSAFVKFIHRITGAVHTFSKETVAVSDTGSTKLDIAPGGSFDAGTKLGVGIAIYRPDAE
jgi:hypothetical protein